MSTVNKKELSERDICTKFIAPALQKAGWDDSFHIREEVLLTRGRLEVRGQSVRRAAPHRVDYVLYGKPNLPIAVIEVKSNQHSVSSGMQQARIYADMLDVPFCYCSNGDAFIEYDRTVTSGSCEREIPLDAFPSPADLLQRFKRWKGFDAGKQASVAQDYYSDASGRKPLYYQQIAIDRTVEAVASGKERALLVMATGTGKTYTAFQIIWRLWKAGIKRRILFLADRNILIDQAQRNAFSPFGSAMTKITGRKIDTSFAIYLAVYQALSGTEETHNIYKQFPPSFFDLVVIDECHRSSADDGAAWHDILEYFSSATQIGFTATPKETKEISNIDYFGPPIYTYSLKQGIEDGFLAPSKVIRIDIDKDVAEHAAAARQQDKDGSQISAGPYRRKNLDRALALAVRTELVARRVTQLLKSTGRYDKTIVFCEDIQHAERMRMALMNENADLVAENVNYVTRITGDNKEGIAQLANFIDPQSRYPVIVTTSKLLATGVDVQTCKLIVLDKTIRSVAEFKQIVSLGARISEEHDKYYSTILDFRGTTRLFSDPQFDGDPAQVYERRPDEAPLPHEESDEVASLNAQIKSIHDVMRKDPGLDGDAQRLTQLSWLLFLKIFDAREEEYEIEEAHYRSPIPQGLRWRDWAADPEGLTGDAILNFINKRLFPGLKELPSDDGNPRARLVREVFRDTFNYMKDGTLIREIVNKLNKIDFNISTDRHVFSDIYEQLLRGLQAGGSAGEYYTPRAVTQFAVDMIDPKLGERILDPACGTGGFLIGSIEHVRRNYVRGVDDEASLQRQIFGIEKKPMPHLLCVTNMLLHDIKAPAQIEHRNTLARPLRDYKADDDMDVILTNLPFGGMEEDGIANNFIPFRTSDTASLFLTLIIHILKPGGRAAIVLPDGMLFGDGIKTSLKKTLLQECDLHTVVRLPNGVFAPYTNIATNILFFEKGRATKEVWYYEHPYPPGYKSYSKTNPIRFKDFEPEKRWWRERLEGDHAWRVSFQDIVARDYNLDIRNPRRSGHASGDKIAEQRIAQARRNKTRKLSLANLGLTHLPPSITQLADLTHLDLDSNNLSSIPEDVYKLENLRTLSIQWNGLTSLPEEIGGLTNLRSLGLTGNRLVDLPRSLLKLPALNNLRLQEIPALALPPELLAAASLAQGDPGAVARLLQYFFSARGEQRRRLNEAKMILVGRGGAGKTSLVNRLAHGKYNPGEVKTDGIAITPWQIQLGKDLVRLNVWDFGGQEIMHATHQFFMTKRSLYLLVLNAREGEQDANIDYWLRLIASFSADSPVLIVVNKIHQHAFELNRRGLQAKFPAIRGFLQTDCDAGTGLEDLHQAILRETDALDHLRDPLPASWFTVKDLLISLRERDGMSFITYHRYQEMCTQSGVTDSTSQETLVGFLHDLGVVLNFRDDPRLSETHVLDPEWVTNGIYKIVNDDGVARRQGELRFADLPSVLDVRHYPKAMHLYLLELMRKFELCYQFYDTDQHYLIPELLGKDQPDLSEFSATDALRLEYRYNFLPEGLLPRFIVRTRALNRDLARWRTGVVLMWEGNRALVSADVQDRRVSIAVIGPHAGKRRLLTVIRTDLEHIHRSVTRLEAIPWVPVPEHPGLALDYKALCVLEAGGEREFKTVYDAKVVKIGIADLLDAVEQGPRIATKTSGQEPVRVVFSYSHKNEELRDQLETHLKLLSHRGLISTWHDRKILAGENCDGVIDDNLKQAQLVLLLVSADFVASAYCYEVEMKLAMQRHKNGEAVIVPVILRPCLWRTAPFGHLQALPKNGKPVTDWKSRDKAWTHVAAEIEKIVEDWQKRRS